MARTAEIKINWAEVESRVEVLKHEKDSPADAVHPYKAGDTYDRVKLSSLDDVNKVFAGDIKGALRLLSSSLTARWEARKADPDAKIKQAVKKLAVTDFFESVGLSFADSANLTTAELNAGVAALKKMREGASA